MPKTALNQYVITDIDVCQYCSHPVRHTYCENCGRKTKAERFTFHYILLHDFIHGVFHLDKGYFYTLKELITRPGHSIREYVQGKNRGKHFNHFTFFIIALSLGHFARHFAHFQVEELFSTHVSREVIPQSNQLIETLGKLVAFLIVPITALINFCMFREAKQNFTEHLILAIYKASVSLLIIALYHVVGAALQPYLDLRFLYIFISALQFLYEFIFCFQYFSHFNYSRKELITRSFMASLLVMSLSVKKWVMLL